MRNLFLFGSRRYVQIFQETRQGVQARETISHSKDIHLTSNNTDRIFFLEVDTPMIHGYKVTFRDILDSKDRYSLVSTVYQGLDRCELFMFCWLLGC